MDMKIVTTGGADASVRLILQEKVHTKAAVDVSRGQGVFHHRSTCIVPIQ